MLRYREDLGLLPQVRDHFPASPRGRHSATARVPPGSAHRQFSEDDLTAVGAGLDLERHYDISPAALAFGLRVIAEPSVRAAVVDLARQLGRIPPTPSRALDFEKERALRSLSR
jgi:hypothetical protein